MTTATDPNIVEVRHADGSYSASLDEWELLAITERDVAANERWAAENEKASGAEPLA